MLAGGGLVVLPEGYEVRLRGNSVDLTSKEFEILALLASAPGMVFYPRADPPAYGGGSSSETDLRSITVRVRKIWEKIEDSPSNPRYAQTVWHVGRKLRDKA
ncbi:winged helix-turn-helix domain-containing protein [Gordonibacter sp.]|uniref:winged helix-turn-helix domain-containing protein n=1 Tax=Gordonibacter sp. TaxID=1968902 RepID=UPI003FA5CB2C